MELYIFGRFLVLEGRDGDFETALREVVVATRGEAGCVEVHGYRAVRNARLYYLHSRWKDVEVGTNAVWLGWNNTPIPPDTARPRAPATFSVTLPDSVRTAWHVAPTSSLVLSLAPTPDDPPPVA